MKNKLLILLITILIAFSLVACAGKSNNTDTKSRSKASSTIEKEESKKEDNKSEEDENLSTPYFWKVTGNGYDGDFYLLGSIHVGDEYTNHYPQEITDAFNACDYLAVESDIIALEKDYATMTKMLQELIYTDGTTIADHIDATLYAAARAILEENDLYENTFEMLYPVFWSSIIDDIYLEETDYTVDDGVDRYFLSKAKKEKKTILEIEDAVETYAAMGALSEYTQELLLKETVDPKYQAGYADDIAELYSVWKKGDIKGHEDLFEDSIEGLTDKEIAAYKEYNDMLLATRNEGMVDEAVLYLEEDMDVFYVVGLAHMIGEGSIVESLEYLGYTVTQVKY